jgi:hypothetical protein
MNEEDERKASRPQQARTQDEAEPFIPFTIPRPPEAASAVAVDTGEGAAATSRLEDQGASTPPAARTKAAPPSTTIEQELSQFSHVVIGLSLFKTVVIVLCMSIIFGLIYPRGTAWNDAVSYLDRAHSQMLDMETGLRAYTVTGVTLFLEPFTSAQPLLNSTMDSLWATLEPWYSSDTTVMRLITELHLTEDAWYKGWAQPALVPHTNLSDVQMTAFLYQGKQMMDNYRMMHLIARDEVEQGRLDNRSQLLAVLVTMFVLLIIALCIKAVYIHWQQQRIRRSVTLPFGELLQRLNRVAAGDFTLQPLKPGATVDVEQVSRVTDNLVRAFAAQLERVVFKERLEALGWSRWAFEKHARGDNTPSNNNNDPVSAAAAAPSSQNDPKQLA